MNINDIKTLILKFIEFVDVVSINSKNKDKELLFILDMLGVSQTHIDYEFDSNQYPNFPKLNELKLRDRIGPNFPDYGFYNCVSEIEINLEDKTEIIIGDAIDDIVDIYKDLSEVLWCFENTSENDALWHYENSYQTHWGEHLRNLQLYVFQKI